MAENIHPMAGEHLPHFIVAPGETDRLFVIMVVFLIVVLGGMGLLYFRLHALPEKMAHRGESTQFQLVGVLSLLALFTHNNLFWVAALLLAALRMPDISSPLASIAGSLGRVAETRASPAASVATPAGTTARAPVDAPPRTLDPAATPSPAAPTQNTTRELRDA